ncbi:hypothetical protein VCHC50A2_1888B, partial [Vibrio cholerae HC-50A2]
ELESWR